MTENPDGELGFVKGFAACAAFVLALVVWLRKGLGALRNGNGKDKNLEERLKRIEDRFYAQDLRNEILDEIEKKHRSIE